MEEITEGMYRRETLDEKRRKNVMLRISILRWAKKSFVKKVRNGFVR